MAIWRRLESWLSWFPWYRRQTREAELARELRDHLELEAEEQQDAGLSPREAAYAAHRALGNTLKIEEDVRAAWGFQWLETLAQDIRYGFRMLGKNPGFTSAAILVLALGLCASVSIFAFVDAALIKPLPYQDPNRLVGVFEINSMFLRSNLSYLDYLDWKKLSHVFSSFDVYQATGVLVTTSAGAQRASGARVTDGFFRTLGVMPVLGRDFYAGEDLPSASRSVLLSYSAWQQRYGGRSDVLGQVVTLDGDSNVIIGVLPRDFQFAPAGRPEFWTAFHASGGCDLKRRCHSIFGVARLKGGVSLRAAVQDVKAIAQQLERQYPDSNRNQGANLVPLRQVVAGEIRPVLMVLLDGAGLLLLIAGVNVAGLLLVRSEHRRREIAVRKALGASLPRLTRQFVTEALLLTLAAAALGLACAYWVVQVLPRLVPENMMAQMPFLDGLGLNGRVLAVAGVIALATALFLSLPPSTRIWAQNLQSGLLDSGRGSAGTVWRRVGSKLVMIELATAIVLTTGAGLLGRSLYRLLTVDLGIDPNHLATIEVVAPPSTYGTDARAIALERQLVSRIEVLPGVKSAAVVVNGVPVSSNGNTTWFRVLGRPWHGEHYDAPQRYISPRYFTTLRARLLRGRYFTQSDDASKPRVAIANRALAARYFADEDPVGKQIAILTNPPLPVQIVGVVDDIREGPLDAPVPPVLYFPFEQSPDTDFTLVVRTSQAERALLPVLAATIRESDPSLVPVNGRTMNDRISDSESAYLHRSLVWVAGGFAVLSLLLSAVGLYGVVAYSVSRRSREIGIRIALGAQRQSIFQLILGEVGWLIGFGMMIGIGCSLGATTLMRGLLFGVSSWDVPSLAAGTGVLGISALLASLVPARRASKVDPMVALRYE
jgi:macrolide transport system ATP-binding/permease protein